MKLTLVKKEPQTKNIVSFWFKPEHKIHYIAGQYIELSLPHDNADNRRTNRWFTLSSSPTEELLAITTKFHPEGSSFKNALFELNIGDSISAQLPMGDFVLPKDDSLPLVFVAAGIGITPYRSMIKYLIDQSETRDITLLYADKSQAEIVFEDLLDKLAIRFIKHFGRLSVDDILYVTGKIDNQIIFISGPEKMVEELNEGLIKKNVDPAQLRADFFHNYD